MKTVFWIFPYLILLLSTSCNVKNPSEHSNNSTGLLSPKAIDKSTAQNGEKVAGVERINLKVQNSQPLESKGHVSGVKSKAEVCIDRIDAGIEIINVTEQWAKEMGLMHLYQADPGFEKWCIFFHHISGTPPYALEQKRLLQSIPDRYYPTRGPSSEDILNSKNSNTPVVLMVSARGYLPGEKITIRLSATGANKEITFYPRPLLLKNEAEEFLGKATLLCAKPGHTLYDIDICELDKEEKYKFTSYSGNETLSHNHKGPTACTISPEIIGGVSGFAKIVVRLDNGVHYTMKLPWGYKLTEYKAGNK